MRPVKSLGNSAVQIGAWRVDPALDEISKDGQTTKLEPKMMELLLCLAAHAGQVVSVKQLLDEVWKDVVVTPDSVYHAVAALRRVLGDDSKDPSYIANVMRRGYRLIAPVVPLDATETPAPSLQPTYSAAEVQAVKPMVEERWSRSIRKITGRQLAIATITVLAVALAYFIADRELISKRYTAAEPPAPAAQEAARRATAASAVAFAPPPHSIAVLPLVNLSGDQEQEYFSDGLTEELLNSLAEINELQVAARTSSFSFKEHPDIATVARRLNVASVLEGSVRRSGHTVRVTVQLINGVNGFHLWSHSYDRDIGDVLKLQTEIANAVAAALQVTLLGETTSRIELGGTRNPEALDAYLRGLKANLEQHDVTELRTAINLYESALGLDPNYALALVGRSLATLRYLDFVTDLSNRDTSIAAALADARKAVSLAPDLGDAHLALAAALETTWPLDFKRTSEEYERAITLSPGNARIQRFYSEFAANMGHINAAITAARRAVVLDPLSPLSYRTLGDALSSANRNDEAVSAYTHALALDPEEPEAAAGRGIAYYALGQFEQARSSCDAKAEMVSAQVCLAMTYHKLGRRTDAEAWLARILAANGDSAAYDYAEIHAQWGDTTKALDWLDKARRLHDPTLENLKTDSLLDPLRKESRFQAIERDLRFPN